MKLTHTMKYSVSLVKASGGTPSWCLVSGNSCFEWNDFCFVVKQICNNVYKSFHRKSRS